MRGRAGRFAGVALLAGCAAVRAPGAPLTAVRATPSLSRPRPEIVAPSPPVAPPPPERALGVRDHGVFGDLDSRVQLAAPRGPVDLLLDRAHGVLVAYRERWPVKVYPVGGSAALELDGSVVALRPGDRAELAAAVSLRALVPGQVAPPGDLDDDGIPDPLDVLMGAHKAVLNAARYDDAYVMLPYPGGDAPRDRGACVDVVVRALRNAGLDLQQAVFDDVTRARAAYPGVTHVDRSIDHRRVRTVVVYFRRHLAAHSATLDDATDPLRPGDIVVLDTFPDRPGPEHMGIVSEQSGPSGRPLVINNWTWGYHTQPMDLLGSVAVTQRYRLP